MHQRAALRVPRSHDDAPGLCQELLPRSTAREVSGHAPGDSQSCSLQRKLVSTNYFLSE